MFYLKCFLINPTEKKPPGYWQDLKNCRAFFDAFAKEKGFDPLDSNHWYSPKTMGELRNTKVQPSICTSSHCLHPP